MNEARPIRRFFWGAAAVVLAGLLLSEDAHACRCIGKTNCGGCFDRVGGEEKPVRANSGPDPDEEYRRQQRKSENERRRKEDERAREAKRQAEERRQELARLREEKRINDNLRKLETLLSEARRLHPVRRKKTATLGPDPTDTARIERELNGVIDRHSVPPFDVSGRESGIRVPLTERDAVIAKMLASETAKKRKAAILRNKPLVIRIKEDSSVKARPNPPWYREKKEMVTKVDHNVRRAAYNYGVDPDLVRAIIWMETTRGWYDEYWPKNKIKSIRPMNVYASYWWGLGYSWEDLIIYDLNVTAGTKLLGLLWKRTENPTVEKVASVYNDLSVERVTEYGKSVDYYYRTRPWKKRAQTK